MKKTRFVQRFFYLFSCLIVWSGMTVSAQEQERRFDLKMQDAELSQVIERLREISDQTFAFHLDDLKPYVGMSFDLKQKTITEILNECLKKTDLAWRRVDDTIIIYKQATKSGMSTVVIKGFIRDKEKNPIIGATIQLVGTTVGMASDVNGWFAIELPVLKGTLEFSFVGYKNKQVHFTEKTDTLHVVLEEDIEALEEVVVTGYQVIKEKGMAGAYAKVKAEDLIMTGNETVEQMLQGKLPGVMVTNTSGLTGTRQKVRVRGTSTLVGNADPVWVVDGIIQEDNLPFEASALAAISDDNLDMMKDFIGGAISWLNPNDIEDITVLKDASATAIYGVKAANGVILITTKKGERGRMSVNYSGNFSLSSRLNYDKMEIMNSKERVELSREAFERGARISVETVGYTWLALAYARREFSLDDFHAGVKKLETVNTDWFDILYRTPFSQSHSVSFSGGDDRTTYRASFGYRNQQNTAKGNGQVGYTGNLNLSAIFWNKLTINGSLSGSHTETEAFASGVDPYSYAINTSRVIACYDGDDLFYYDKNGYNYNILNELSNSGNENTAKSLNLNLSARWLLTESLTLSATLGGATSSSFGKTWFAEQSHNISSIRGYEYGEYSVLDDEYKQSPLPYGGMLTVTESRNFNYTARLQAEYVKLFNGVHSVNFVAGLETRSNKYDGFSQTNWGYMPDRGESFTDVPLNYGINSNIENKKYARTVPKVTNQIANYVSYYVTGSYMYDNRYSINLSLRGDASNRFGDSGKFQTVWSAGLRWNVTDEPWMQNQNLVNNLSFTASFGYQGNVIENISPDFIAKIEAIDSNTGEYVMSWSQLPNPDLKPEKTLSVNLGANFALFKSKLNGTFNWYYKKTTDVITQAKVPYENGTTSMNLNDGHVKNEGWDLTLSVVPVRTKDFMWSLGTSFSGNNNKVNSNLETNGSWENAVSGALNKEGYPVGSFWAFKFAGLNPNNGAPQFDFSRANTTTAEKDASEYMVYMGTREPTFTLGINMVFRWKRFSFPLNFYISRGNYEFLDSPYENGYMMLSEYQNASTQLKDRWRKPGDEKYTDIPSIPVGDNCRPLRPFVNSDDTIYPLEAWAYSNVRVVNAWYIRFNDFQFSYNLPDKWIKGFAKSVTLSFSATNPLQIKSKDFKGRDPEVALGQQPRSQDFSLGVKLSF